MSGRPDLSLTVLVFRTKVPSAELQFPSFFSMPQHGLSAFPGIPGATRPNLQKIL